LPMYGCLDARTFAIALSALPKWFLFIMIMSRFYC
jgi:hypothetical protein